MHSANMVAVRGKLRGPDRILSVKRQKFAELVAHGCTQGTAFRMVFSPNCTRRTAEVEGSRLALQPAVAALIRETREAGWRASAMSLAERRDLLAGIARKAPATAPTHGERVRAIELDSRLAGDLDAETQVSVDVSVAQVWQALERSQRTASAVGPAVEVEAITSDAPAPTAVVELEDE